jgi:predicted nucleotidyltransferase
MRSSSLGNVLFTKTHQRVLGLLFGRPEQSFYLNQIMDLSKIGRGKIKRELERMEAAGIVLKKKIGNQSHYQANPECPIYRELSAIVRKTFGVADVIKSALESVSDKVMLAFIFGSIAKAEDTAESDVDLLVVSNEPAYAEVMELLLEAEHSLGRPVNPTLYSLTELEARIWQDNAFVSRVLKQPKIWIKEDEDVYRNLGESGKDQKT